MLTLSMYTSTFFLANNAIPAASRKHSSWLELLFSAELFLRFPSSAEYFPGLAVGPPLTVLLAIKDLFLWRSSKSLQLASASLLVVLKYLKTHKELSLIIFLQSHFFQVFDYYSAFEKRRH